MNDTMFPGIFLVTALVLMLAGIGYFVLNRGWFERSPSNLPEDIDPKDHTRPPLQS